MKRNLLIYFGVGVFVLLLILIFGGVKKSEKEKEKVVGKYQVVEIGPGGEKVVGEREIKIGGAIPEKDVAGTDLERVPRYYPSVRTSFDKSMPQSKAFVSVTLSYTSPDKVDKVYQFYLNEMPKKDWQLKNKNEDFKNGLFTLEYDCKSCQKTTTVSLTIRKFEEEKVWTIIDINYFEQQ